MTWSRHFESLKKLRLGQIQPGEVVEAPKFKKKHRAPASFRYPDPKQFPDRTAEPSPVSAELGWVRYRNSRVIRGTPCNVTVSCNGGKWFISIQTERGIEKPIHPSPTMVGIDLGVVRFVTLSNREMVPPCHALQQEQARLKRYQRRMARCKFSQNWRKAKAQVNAVYRKIAEIRNDFLHQTTTAISTKPRGCRDRRPEGAEPVEIGCREEGESRLKRETEIWSELGQPSLPPLL